MFAPGQAVLNEVIRVSSLEIEQLRHLIENTLGEAGMSGTPWYCVMEPCSERLRQTIDRRPVHRSVRVVWKKREDLLEFFDENGGLFQTIPVAEGGAEASAGLSAAAHGV